MAERLYLTLEMLAIILCAANVFGKKVRIDFPTVSVVFIDLLMIKVVQEYHLSDGLLATVYVAILIYCGVEYKKSWKELIFRYIIMLLFVVLLQAVCSIPVVIFKKYLSDAQMGFLVNSIFLLITFIIYQKVRVSEVLDDFVNKNQIGKWLSVICGIAIVLVLVFTFKKEHELSIPFYVMILAFIVIAVSLIVRWLKTDQDLKEKEMEIQFSNMYDGAFKDLIDTTRMRQHDFKNHIQAMLCMAYSADSKEEIVKRQEDYCKEVMGMIQENELLYKVCAHPLAAFLHSKVTAASENNILTDYRVLINKCEVGIPLHEIVEITGILLDNAYEAVEKYPEERRKVEIFMEEKNGRLMLRISNPAEFSSVEQFSKYMDKGVSTKGENRGLGLEKIKKYSKKYKVPLKITVENKENTHWICFELQMGMKK